MKNKFSNMINKIKLLCHSELYSESFINQLKSAFTLAEVLLATAIVGIIAGLVLPTTISKVQNRGFDQAYERNVQAVADAINSLIVVENKDFFKTEMYKDSTPSNYDSTSGTFMKNYMKISKYCGSGDAAKNCFADTYYKYNQNKKEVYEPTYKGACAILKNGASICLTPQIGATAPKGIIDLNGKKGPNVYGRDIRNFSLTSKTRIGMDKTQNGILVTHAPDLGLGKTACEKDPNSLACCNTKTITSDSDPCCAYPEIKTTNTNCDPPDPCESDPQGLACCQKMGLTMANKNWCCTYEAFQTELLCNPNQQSINWRCSCGLSSCSCTVKRIKSSGTTDVQDGYFFDASVCYYANSSGSRVCYKGSDGGANHVRPGYRFGPAYPPHEMMFLDDCKVYQGNSAFGSTLFATECSGTQPEIVQLNN